MTEVTFQQTLFSLFSYVICMCVCMLIGVMVPVNLRGEVMRERELRGIIEERDTSLSFIDDEQPLQQFPSFLIFRINFRVFFPSPKLVNEDYTRQWERRANISIRRECETSYN